MKIRQSGSIAGTVSQKLSVSGRPLHQLIRRYLLLILAMYAPHWSPALGDSVAPRAADDSVAAELKSFELAPGFTANLFASETHGIANPITMRWDARGRLWVLCSSVYPQVVPTEKANDKLFILSDTNDDHRVDTSNVFVDGLNMPTGFAIGDGGVYIGEGSDLVHWRDTNGDERADQRELIFTGFGTGDTHQNINSFTWSPGGELFFCQGLHCFSRTETPWGIARLDEHGVWRLRPRRRQLHSFRGGSSQNPWGVVFGRWGEPLVKGGSGTALSELLPIMVQTDHFQPPLDIGKTQIKSMIAQIVESSHLPSDMQGDVLIAGYFGHLLDRMKLSSDRAGHQTENMPPLLRTNHRSFRPVDIQIGPDGAIYVADWYNPIIGHYQASFRHPDRDKSHGRIWRITAKDRPLSKPPALAEMSASELCEQLKSKESWVRSQAKRRLMDLPTEQALAAVRDWLDNLPSDSQREHLLYEAIGVFESHEVVNRPLLEQLLAARNDRARAYATRVVGRWHDRLRAPLDMLGRSIVDPSPRVRLEAVVACSYVRDPAAITVASQAASQPMDRFLVAALSQCVHALASNWLPALQAGNLSFEQPEQLVYVLRAHGGNDVATQVRQLLQNESLSKSGRDQLLELLARVGNATDTRMVFDAAVVESATNNSHLLSALTKVVEARHTQPSGDIQTTLETLFANEQSEVRAAAIRLAGLWRQKQLTGKIKSLVVALEVPEQVRAAAIRSLMELSPDDAFEDVQTCISHVYPPVVRLAALEAVSRVDLNVAARDGLKLLTASDDSAAVAPILATLMQRRDAATAIASALPNAKLSVDQAKLISRWVSANGVDDPALVSALTTVLGITNGAAAAYSPDLVQQIAARVRRGGDPLAGQRVFTSSLTNCTACHQVHGVTTSANALPKGPELTAVGAGLQLELIIESVVWPKRQIKEGYELTTLFLDDGRAVSGYVTAENGGVVAIRNLTTGRVEQYSATAIDERAQKGTAMPAGFTNTLTNSELRDLVAYLATLKGAPTRDVKASGR
jgi:putative heme-binding domain-containing protein